MCRGLGVRGAKPPAGPGSARLSELPAQASSLYGLAFALVVNRPGLPPYPRLGRYLLPSSLVVCIGEPQLALVARLPSNAPTPLATVAPTPLATVVRGTPHNHCEGLLHKAS